MDVRERAAAYINVKPRTEFEVVRYLRGKGFDSKEIAETVAELKEYSFIDDLNYCRMYFEYGFDKGRGIIRIKKELADKGVKKDVIQQAFDELDDIPDQLEKAMEIGRCVIYDIDVEAFDYKEKQKLKAKLGRRLVSRGFSMEIVYKVMDRLL